MNRVIETPSGFQVIDADDSNYSEDDYLFCDIGTRCLNRATRLVVIGGDYEGPACDSCVDRWLVPVNNAESYRFVDEPSDEYDGECDYDEENNRDFVRDGMDAVRREL